MHVAARIKIGSGRSHGLVVSYCELWLKFDAGWLDTCWHSHGVARHAGQMALVSNICSQWRMVLVTEGLIPVGLVEIKCHAVMIKVNLTIISCCGLWCIIVLFLFEAHDSVPIGFVGLVLAATRI